jgi:hypothetical protein
VGEPTECRMTKKGLWIKGFLYKDKDRSDRWWEHLQALNSSDSKRRVGFSIQGKIVRRNGKSIDHCWLQDVAITASPVNTNTWAEIVKSLSGEDWCLNPEPIVLTSSGIEPAVKNLDEGKALAAGGQGATIIPESLDEEEKDQSFGKALITYDEAVTELQLQQGYSRVLAKAIADSIFIASVLH